MKVISSYIVERVAKNISSRRRMLGLTQSQVAEMIGVENETISRMESGKIALTLERLEQFANIFECSIGELVKDDIVNSKEQATLIAEIISPLDAEAQKMIVKILSDLVAFYSKK